MTSNPITSWRKEVGKVEAMTDFVFLGSKIPVDGDCSHEIKRCLINGRNAMTKLESILKAEVSKKIKIKKINKSRGVTLLAKSTQSKLWFFQ